MRCSHRDLKKRREVILWNLKADMRKYSLSPVLGSRLLKVLGGETPRLGRLQPLGLEQVMNRAYKAQNTVGWKHMAKGRVPREVLTLQERWVKEYGKSREEKEKKPELTVTKTLSMELLAQYEVWKARYEEAQKVDIPIHKQVKLREVKRLLGEEVMVEARDRFLLETGHIPTKEDLIQRLEDWIKCVKGPCRRAAQTSVNQGTIGGVG